MVLGAVTLTFSNLALQIIIGAIAAALTGRAMRGAGFGLLGDLLFGVIGALVANFAVSYFNLFDSGHYGLPGEIIVAVIGAVLLVMVTHLFSRRRTSSSAV
jgi:uncharacterized membrane protein YeaQ/YmgE (transglycosylase-associated protein family)